MYALANLAAALLIAQPAPSTGPPAPSTGPPTPLPPPRIVSDERCQRTDDPEEIVVCARNEENSPYRIPRALRGATVIEDRDASHDTRFRDQEALGRFSDQVVGPGGVYRRSRQVDCEWRAARQELRGERPDCGRRGGQ